MEALPTHHLSKAKLSSIGRAVSPSLDSIEMLGNKDDQVKLSNLGVLRALEGQHVFS
jgi:hypothetical protein